MKKLLLLAGLILSVSAFASEDLVSQLQALEAEYQNLSSQEEARFNEEKAQADAAKAALAENERVYSELSARAERLKAEANTKFFKNQYEELASKYSKALDKLQDEMKSQRSVIADFEKIESLRSGN